MLRYCARANYKANTRTVRPLAQFKSGSDPSNGTEIRFVELLQ